MLRGVEEVVAGQSDAKPLPRVPEIRVLVAVENLPPVEAVVARRTQEMDPVQRL